MKKTMRSKAYLTTLLLTLCGALGTHAQTIRQGAQVTAEENVVSGKPYLLY